MGSVSTIRGNLNCIIYNTTCQKEKTISKFNWSKAFENLAIDEKVAILNQNLLKSF